MNEPITASGEMSVTATNITWNLSSGTFDDLLATLGVVEEDLNLFKTNEAYPQLDPFFQKQAMQCKANYKLIKPMMPVSDRSFFNTVVNIEDMRVLCDDAEFKSLEPCILDFEGKFVKGIQVSRLHHYSEVANCFGTNFCSWK